MSTKRSRNQWNNIQNEEKENNSDEEFEIILKAFCFTGMIFTPFKTIFSLKGFAILCLDIIIETICVYFVFSNAIVTLIESPHSTGHAFILSIANVIGLCMRIIIITKRGRIRKCSEIIFKLNQDMLPATESKSLRKFGWIGSSFALIFPVGLMIVGFISRDFHCGLKRLTEIYFYTHRIDSSSSIIISVLVVTFRTLNILFIASVPMLTVVMCTFIFTRLRDINLNFLSLLQKSMDMKLPSKFFSDYTIFYGRITTAIEKAEKTLSLVSFFLYGYMLSCVFAVTSYMVTRSPETYNVAGILFQSVIFIEMVGLFIFLSIRAASVNESAVEVKNLIHSLPAKRFDFDSNLTATLLQLANNFASEVCVTGWGLFTINRGFILTTGGVVVTYGVILFQLGST
ncbi:hypothetical protein JTE90_027528 [Oedothorax gibbosus]|uniref:Gustatory receptor n=1 Tax=Oedothorax gibbosus TaxID=931172 RepID=A0AAV6VJ41_9ARAC|nr:hypothetical protein JTE90_027528 [Oedothorax gibbosus]